METDSPPTAEQKPPKLRWLRLTPNRLVFGLLVVEGFLLLSECFDWFDFNRQTWTVEIVLAAVGATLLVMFVWLVVALLFRRRFQFSLRSLMLLVVAVAVAFSWVAVERQQERKQKAAADEIEKGGGRVESEPTWLGKVLRDDSLVSVTGVFLVGTAATTDAEMVHLEGLTQLQVLWLNSTEVTDSELVHLAGLRQLKWLDLRSTRISDAGLVHLQGLGQLEMLLIGGTRITDAAVKRLRQALPKCKILR